METKINSKALKAEALRLGFSACGIAPAEPIDQAHQNALKMWLEMCIRDRCNRQPTGRHIHFRTSGKQSAGNRLPQARLHGYLHGAGYLPSVPSRLSGDRHSPVALLLSLIHIYSPQITQILTRDDFNLLITSNIYLCKSV